MLTRREFCGAAAAAALPSWEIHGVRLGVQSYSFRDQPFERMLETVRKADVTCLELVRNHIEPQPNKGEKSADYRQRLRAWRAAVPLEHFRTVKEKIRAAGVEMYAYMLDFREPVTGSEIARGFEMAKALGVSRINSSSTISVVKQVDKIAFREKIHVGLHNHSWSERPNEVTSPENHEQAWAGCSRFTGSNLDVGHLYAAGFDPLAFLEKHHARITTLHLKDRKKNDGPDMSFGQGDTPIKEILQLMKRRRWRFPAMIEYEIQGPDTFEQVRRALEYCRDALG